jgi:hypothetical protein
MVDKIGEKTAVLGIPGLVLVTALGVWGWPKVIIIAVVASMVAGPLGTLLGLAIVLAKVAVEVYGAEKLFHAAARTVIARGSTKETIKEKVDDSFVFFAIKEQLSCYLDTLDAENTQQEREGEKGETQ